MAKYGKNLPKQFKHKLYNLNRQVKELNASHKSITPSSITNKQKLQATVKSLEKQLYNLRQSRDIESGNIRKAINRANRNPQFQNKRDRQLIQKGQVKQGTVTTKLGYQTSLKRQEEFNQLTKKAKGKMSATLKGIERRKNKELYDLISGKGIQVEGLPTVRTSPFRNILPEFDFIRSKEDYREKQQMLEKLLTREGRMDKLNSMYSPNLERATAFFESFEDSPKFAKMLSKMSPQARIILNQEMAKYFEALNYQSGDTNNISDTPMSNEDIQQVMESLYKRMEEIQKKVDKKYK